MKVHLVLVMLAAVQAEEPPAEKTPQERLLEELKGQGHILSEKYRDNRRWDICIMRADGAEVRHLTNTGDLHEHLPCAAPRSNRIFYVRIPSLIGRGRLWPFKLYAHLPWEWEGHLWRTDPAGKSHQPVTYDQGGRRVPVTEASGVASLDADTVIYGEPWNQRIVVLHLKTGRRELYPVTGPPRHLAVAPDGRSVWYAAPGLGWNLYRLDLRTRKVQPMGGGDFVWPTVSGDGTKVVHAVEGRPDLTGGLEGRCLVIRDAADGKNLRLLLSEKGISYACPTWGPGDRYIAYSVRKGKSTWSIRVTRLADMVTVPVTLRRQGHRINPQWIAPPGPTSQPGK